MKAIGPILRRGCAENQKMISRSLAIIRQQVKYVTKLNKLSVTYKLFIDGRGYT